MKIITCASYYGTGSSAVTDFFSEFGNICSAGGYEFRFIHDPDGIRDLEYHIIENNNRHNTSNAIKRYLRYARYYGEAKIRQGYRRFMGPAFMKYTYEYIDRLTELQADTQWHFDRIEKTRLFSTMDTIVLKLGIKLLKRWDITLLNLTHEKSYYSAISQEDFLSYTKDYIKKVVGSLNKDGSEYVMVDQLLPPSNLDQYLKYFDDVHVVVTERDPRDIYILAKERWHEKVAPLNCVEDYCKWYEIIRRHKADGRSSDPRVLYLQFEDMIYHYEETAEKLMRFAGVDPKDRMRPRNVFDPAVSIHNTNLKPLYPQYADDVRYIEEHLSGYLYQFPEPGAEQM